MIGKSLTALDLRHVKASTNGRFPGRHDTIASVARPGQRSCLRGTIDCCVDSLAKADQKDAGRISKAQALGADRRRVPDCRDATASFVVRGQTGIGQAVLRFGCDANSQDFDRSGSTPLRARRSGSEARVGGTNNDPKGDNDSPENLLAWAEFHEQVEELPENEREVFQLIWYSGTTQREAAELLGISERTVLRRYCRARLQLKNTFQGTDNGENEHG